MEAIIPSIADKPSITGHMNTQAAKKTIMPMKPCVEAYPNKDRTPKPSMTIARMPTATTRSIIKLLSIISLNT